ncbi:S8 family peptidase [Actinophytocola sediminis]
MSHHRARLRVAGLTVAAVASTVVFAAAPATAEPAATSTPTPGPTPDTVTLVTGDVVTLGGPRGVHFTPAPGREHIGFRSHTDVHGDVHVIPDDAVTSVSAGRLDPRLFDISELVRTGYGDADRADLPLIVDYPGATPKAAGARTVRELASMGATALRAEKDTRFWAGAGATATRIWLDGPVTASLEHSVPQIGAPAAWAAGLTGSGATVAVLDTGIDVTHPDLSDAVVAAQDFTGSQTGTDDHYGHGTHVASIVTGAGERNRGVAPDTKLLNGKVLSDFGEGYESGVIAGMEWAASNDADVVNLSLGGGPTDGTDPMSAAVNRLTADTGTLFVVAAGNQGPDPESIDTPGAADAALTVGAVDRDERLADFSSRGPRWQNGAIKPDITAPGVGIVAAAAANGKIGRPVDGYVALDGTSMATPHVAGAAAILAAAHPDWSAERLKSTLMATAAPNPALSVFEQGAGRVDVAAAVTNTVSATPANLFVGLIAWPHDDDQPIAKPVTYTNTGTEPVTFDLTTDLRGPDGEPAPAGMFTLSATEITVPAGGSAQVTLTTDTSVDSAEGIYRGAVLATAGETTLRTLVAVNREAEAYEVKLSFVDHDGAPATSYGMRMVDLNAPEEYTHYDPSGSFVLRLPRGEYFLDATVESPYDEWSWRRTDFVEPKIVVDGPAEYVLDARDGVSPHFVVDEPNARPTSAYLHYTADTAWGQTRFHGIVSKYHSYGIRPSRTSAPGAFEYNFDAYLAEPEDSGEWLGFHESPYQYSLRETVDGVVPADQEFRVTNDELATVNATHAQATPGMAGVRDSFVTMSLPFTMTDYYTPDTNWFPSFYEGEPGNILTLSGMIAETIEPVSYPRGSTTRTRWNVGVFAPAMPRKGQDPTRPSGVLWEEYLARQGDELSVRLPLRGDQNLGRDSGQYPGEGTTELLRDGEVIARTEYAGELYAELPPETATYTLRVSTPQPGRLSTEVTAEWTFVSGHTEPDRPTLIPAMAVRFAPDLDDHNAAPAGRFAFPVTVQRNGAESPGQVGTPTVEVSYDDGATWAPARVNRTRGGWRVEVNHPRDAEFVSLRSSVADRDGNLARQTIIHAYALRK